MKTKTKKEPREHIPDSDRDVITVHLPRDVGSRIRAIADEQHRSASAQVVFVLDGWLKGKLVDAAN